MSDQSPKGDNRSHCPNCGESGFDGQGQFTTEAAAIREGGQAVKYVATWYQMRCWDCGQVFAVQESEEEIHPGEEPAHAQ